MEIDQSIAVFVKENWERELDEIRQQENAGYDLKTKVTYTLEELIDGVRRGQQFLYTLKMNFEPKEILGGGFTIPFITDFFDVVEDRPENLLLASSRHNVSMVAGAVPCEQMKPLREWVAQTEEGLKSLNLSVKMFCIESKERMEYFCFEIPTSKGKSYNVTFRYPKGELVYSGTLNCLSEEKAGMGLLLEALVHVAEEMNC